MDKRAFLLQRDPNSWVKKFGVDNEWQLTERGDACGWRAWRLRFSRFRDRCATWAAGLPPHNQKVFCYMSKKTSRLSHQHCISAKLSLSCQMGLGRKLCKRYAPSCISCFVPCQRIHLLSSSDNEQIETNTLSCLALAILVSICLFSEDEGRWICSH